MENLETTKRTAAEIEEKVLTFFFILSAPVALDSRNDLGETEVKRTLGDKYNILYIIIIYNHINVNE